MLTPHRLSNPDLELWSNASGSWGCGAYWQGLWFQVKPGSQYDARLLFCFVSVFFVIPFRFVVLFTM